MAKPVFSGEDGKWIYDQLSALKLSSQTVPALLPSASGDGFIKTDQARLNLRDLIQTSSSNHLSYTELANSLGIGIEHIEPLLGEDSVELGLQIAGQQILTRTGHQNVMKSFYSELQNGLVSRALFSKLHSIPEKTLDLLVEESNDAVKKLEEEYLHRNFCAQKMEFDQDLYGTETYKRDFERKLLAFLITKESKIESPIFINSSDIEGNPSRGLIRASAEKIIATGQISGKLVASSSTAEVFISTQLIKRSTDRLTERLLAGDVIFISYTSLMSLGVSQRECRNILNAAMGDNVALRLESGLISELGLRKLFEEGTEQLEKNGFLSISSVISEIGIDGSQSTAEDMLKVQTIITDRLGKENIVSEGFIFTAEYQRVTILNYRDRAILQARTAWFEDEELKLKSSNLQQHPDESRENTPLMGNLFKDKLRKEAQEAYNEEIKNLQDSAMGQFCLFWLNTVQSKIQLHDLGLKNLTDSKLVSYLEELRQRHYIDNLLPDAIKRSHITGLVRGKFLKKTVEKLELAIAAAQTSELPDQGAQPPVEAAIESFRNTLKLKDLSSTFLDDKKEQQVQEMKASMAKEENGSRLYLILLVLFLARYRPGIVYASGKFAPRLLKQLQGVEELDREVLDRLIELKDAVKSGSISPEEKEDMRSLIYGLFPDKRERYHD